jgi:hypothetical protein
MKNKNYHAVKIVLKSNRKIIETSNIDITSTHIHDRSIPSTHIHDRSIPSTHIHDRSIPILKLF